MKTICVKVASFFAVFILLQLMVIPWLEELQLMPLWGDIAVISLSLVAWVEFIERLTTTWREDELNG